MTLAARDITFGYAGRPALYAGFSLEVAPGERVALSAPSGFGKTTLCRILAGYEHPQGGAVTVDGAPLPRRGACPVQLIGQHPESVLDPRMRMEASLAEAGAVSDDLLDALGIRDAWLRRFPHELSGGELQRFCIARALAASPRYLVADEISTMLDAVTQAQLWRFIIAAADERGMGIVLVSHSPALTARIATRTVDLAAARAEHAAAGER
ncbi:ABC transporter ATP-binding protein [Adlercreutzia sp. ZJ242]|uniref:ABC transporter ATP-binding protein n=1 Tax=Adlercreutzia sp. ZJ242 TaxID=2709409 RepID=UPI0013ECB828|nr:ATP-binding cassette domain-containing protein [Adlercreutzia sp. ZJ242]